MKINAGVLILLIQVTGFIPGEDIHSTIISGTNVSSDLIGYVEDQIVVNFDSNLVKLIDKNLAATEGLTGVPELDQLAWQFRIRSFLQKHPHSRIRYYQGRLIDLRGWFKVKFSDRFDVETVVSAFKLLNGVLDAQPIGIHTVDATPNDTYYDLQWHLNQTSDHDVDAPEAWDLQTGNSSIIVGMLDSGVRYYHRDLGGVNASPSTPENSRGNMWTNTTELSAGPTNGIDDDGNGYDDDWIGWDFVDNVEFSIFIQPITGEDYQDQDNDPRDFNGHGTHCAGNIGALNNNGIGLNAVSGGWGNGSQQISGNGVHVMALRIGYSANYLLAGGEVGLVQMDFAADAMRYAADNGARIISCSWGSSSTGGIGAAIDYFLASGGIIFKSAGNDNDDAADYMGSRTDNNLINVAATNESDVKSSFSSYGSWVEISAPGSNIYSTYHDHSDPNTDYYASISGTSMATPITASVAALIWSANPSLNANQVRQILYNNADNIDAQNPSYVGELGAGRVNAYNAMTDAALPVELSSFSAKHIQNDILLEWETGAEINNAGFEVYRSEIGDGEFYLISSYLENPTLIGLGNSTTGKKYSYLDDKITLQTNYWYKLIDVDINGNRTEHDPLLVKTGNGNPVDISNGQVPSVVALYQNFPNPFNPNTTIRFDIPKHNERNDQLEMTIYNIVGQKIIDLYQGGTESGAFEITWNGLDQHNQPVPTGIYIAVMKLGLEIKTRKMFLIR
jgi:subtilisin family serine protease